MRRKHGRTSIFGMSGMKRGRLSRILPALMLLAWTTLPAAAQAQKAKAQASRAAMVGVDKVVEEPISQTIPIIGRLVTRRAGVVASRARGPVQDVLVEVGDRVAKGDVLAILVQDRLKHVLAQQDANLKEKEAELATSLAQVSIARQTLRRQERLRKSKSAAFRVALYEDSRLELAKTQSEVAEARAAIARAKINIELAQLDLDYTVIKAPYPGVITRRHTEAGAFLNVGGQVVSMIDDNALEIEADVPVDRLSALPVGAKVKALITDAAFEAKVRALIPEENNLTRTRAVRFTAAMQAVGIALASNQSVTIELPLGKARQVTTVHKDAVLTRQGNDMVFLVQDGAAQPRPVRLGDGIGNRFEVLSGLAVGDLVVIRGNERLFPGQKVTHRP